MKKYIGILLLSVALISCNKKEVLHFYSLDETQCITVITEDTVRYVIDGNYKTLPDTNFVKLDISKITELGDGVHMCWKNGQYEWDVVIDKSKIIENKLDTSRFNFNTKLPVDERNIPTEKKFRGEKCAIYNYYLKKLSPDKGAIIK